MTFYKVLLHSESHYSGTIYVSYSDIEKQLLYVVWKWKQRCLEPVLKVAKGLFYLSKKLISVISVKIVPHMTYNVFGGTLNPTLLLLCNFLT